MYNVSKYTRYKYNNASRYPHVFYNLVNEGKCPIQSANLPPV